MVLPSHFIIYISTFLHHLLIHSYMIFSLLGFFFDWTLQFFPYMSTPNFNLNHDSSINHPEEETIPDSFICCVCLELLYKPIVLECGHVSCFWCVHKSMDPIRESHCPICRNAYHHFPNICEMLHFLLLKMYPIAYSRREKEVFEEEKVMDFFSPELKLLPEKLSTSCMRSEEKDCLIVDTDSSDSIQENGLPETDHDRTCSRVSRADLLCPACQQFLFHPAVLNCGHVFCEACLKVPEDGVIICKVCEIPHPNDYPNTCLELNNFLEEQFPEEYAVRKENEEQMQAPFQHKNPSSCSGSGSGSEKSAKRAFKDNDEGSLWWRERGSKVHFGAGCDHCGAFPIVGDRYRCQDCVEAVGFDLCADCYNTRSKRPGRFNQRHTPDHRFELIKPPDRARNLVLRLVEGHLVDSSGAPILAISAMEDSPDGWIAVESGLAGQISHDNAVAPDGNHDRDILNDLQNDSISMEISDSPGTTSDSIGPVPSQHDHTIEHLEEDSPSTS